MDKTEQIIIAIFKTLTKNGLRLPIDATKVSKIQAELISCVSEIVEKDRWISVEDELPKIIKADDGSVNCILIYYDHNAEPGSQYSVVNTAWSNGHIENANKGMFKRWFTWYKYLPPSPEQEG